jgi:hypothetical protein
MKTILSSMFVSLLFVATMNANADAAFVFRGELCFPTFIPEEGDPIDLIGDQTQGVAVDAGFDRGVFNAGKATCQGFHEVPLERAQIQRGACFFPASPLGPLFTENGRLVMSPDGSFTLFCRFPRADIPG